MWKRILFSFANGFCYSIGLTLFIQVMVMVFAGETPLLPEFAARFDNPLVAFAAQLLLIGVMSAITSAGTVVFELKKIGIVLQSVLFLAIMLAAWIPTACIAWGFHKYIGSMITTTVSIIVTYAICWGIQYRLCKREIAAINAKLLEKKGEFHGHCN